MTKVLTRTELLAKSVKVNVVFFVFGDDESGADPIVTLVRRETDVERFAAEHGRTIRIEQVYWQELPLHESWLCLADTACLVRTAVSLKGQAIALSRGFDVVHS